MSDARRRGAAPADRRRLDDPSLAMRCKPQAMEKSRIGQAAAAVIANGDAIVLVICSEVVGLRLHRICHCPSPAKRPASGYMITDDHALRHLVAAVRAPGIAVILV